ncbi:MAG: hypothetical protein IT437_06670 [Phycisphaerales bacterium]|nr:hypothetical protein [Phycisphaerales bacterium]
MRSVLTLASVALISAPSALAQETVTFSFEFDHAVLQPGQVRASASTRTSSRGLARGCHGIPTVAQDSLVRYVVSALPSSMS